MAAAVANIGFFSANVVGALNGSEFTKPIVHLFDLVAGANPRIEAAAVTVLIRSVAQTKKAMLRILEFDEDFEAYFCAEFVGDELTNPLGALPALPALFLANVVVRALAQLPGHAALYGGGGALNGHGTANVYGEFAAIAAIPAAGVANNRTFADLYTVIRAVVTKLPVVANRAAAAALSCYLNLSIALAKRGQSTNTYLQKRVRVLRTEFAHEDYECSVRLIRTIWTMFLSDLAHADAPRFLQSMAAYAPPNSPIFREILRQAQFSGFSTTVFIVNAVRKYPSFPWNDLVQVGGLLHQEYNALLADMAAIQADPYAAFGQVKPRGNPAYKHLAYIAAELLVNVGHYTTARAGLSRNGSCTASQDSLR